MITLKFRSLFGFMVAPGLPALVLYFLGMFLVEEWEAEFGPRLLSIFAYSAAVIIGCPVYLFLRKNNIESLKGYLAWGALIGLACYLLVFGLWAILGWKAAPEHTILLLKNSIWSGLIAVIYSAIASAIFWLIAIKRY